MSLQSKEVWADFIWVCVLKLLWPTLGIVFFLGALIGYLNCLWWIWFQFSWEGWLLSPLKIINHNVGCLALVLRIANNSGLCCGTSVNNIATSQTALQLRSFWGCVCFSVCFLFLFVWFKRLKHDTDLNVSILAASWYS